MKVELEIDTADVIEKALTQDLGYLVKEIRRLRKIDPLKDYQIEDLADNIRFARGILEALRYYMCSDNHKVLAEKYVLDLDLTT